VLYVFFFYKYTAISEEEEIVSTHFGEWKDNLEGQTEATGWQRTACMPPVGHPWSTALSSDILNWSHIS
jgi:hypothetical protein